MTLTQALTLTLTLTLTRYAVSLGHAHGLAGMMPGVAIALPLVDGRVV